MTLVVVGAGLAGGTAVTTLRELGYDGELVLYGAEPHPPYERPPLSKGYLTGSSPLEDVFVHDPAWYDDHDVDLRLGTVVTDVDPTGHTVRTAAGEQRYDQLLLATGASPRRLPLVDDLARDHGVPVAYLRTIEDSRRLKEAFGAGRRVVIVGGGWIGLEVAAAARDAGSEVTVLEVADLPLAAVLGHRVAQVFTDLHREHGVEVGTGRPVAAADLEGADLVVVGIGAVPETALAERAGLEVDNGVLVDAQLRTSHPDVLAVGDAANQAHPLLGRRVRVEHWDNAIEQAKVAAAVMTGAEGRYDRLPYFFSDQYDLGMEYVGRAVDVDEVELRGDPAGRVFTAYWSHEGQVVAGMQANDWDAMDEVRARVGGPS